MCGGGRRWQRWSCFHVLAKKKGRVTLPQPAVWGTGQEGSWESTTQTICSPSTQKSSRNPDLQGGNPTPEVGSCPWSCQVELGHELLQARPMGLLTSRRITCSMGFAGTDCSLCWTPHLIYACSNCDWIKPNYFWKFSVFPYPNARSFILWKPSIFFLCDFAGKTRCLSQNIV